MKILTITFLFAGGLLVNIYDITNGQNHEYPDMFYKPLKFDYAIRGGFNISNCLQELLLCYEVVRAEHVCHYDENIDRESICSFMRDHCHDLLDDLNVFWYDFDLFEPGCKIYNLYNRQET